MPGPIKGKGLRKYVGSVTTITRDQRTYDGVLYEKIGRFGIDTKAFQGSTGRNHYLRDGDLVNLCVRIVNGKIDPFGPRTDGARKKADKLHELGPYIFRK